MKLANRIEALEVRARKRGTRHVVVHQLPAGRADEAFGIAAEGPPIEWRDCGGGVLWLVLRRPRSGLTREQVEALRSVDEDPAMTVVKRISLK